MCLRACMCACAVVDSPERRRSEGGTECVGLAGQTVTATEYK